jgi:hypothetical protein
MITNSKYNAHTKPLFSKLANLTINQLTDFQIGCFVYRCINYALPIKFCALYNINAFVHSYNTRQSKKLHCDYRRLNVRSNTVRHYGVLLWNSLTDDICSAISFSMFKHKLKSFVLTN